MASAAYAALATAAVLSTIALVLAAVAEVPRRIVLPEGDKATREHVAGIPLADYALYPELRPVIDGVIRREREAAGE